LLVSLSLNELKIFNSQQQNKQISFILIIINLL
jgi:hypothetical protein